MRHLRSLWNTFERIPGLGLTPTFWQQHCGPDYPVIQPFLRATTIAATRHPCPNPIGAGCPRRIIDYGDGEIIAKCQDLWQECGDLPLSRGDILVHEVDIHAFTKTIAIPLGIRWENPQKRDHCVWSIGLSIRRNSRNQPVFFIALHGEREFRTAVSELLVRVAGPFVLIAPTNRYRTAEIQERLQTRGIGFISLEEHLCVDEAGKFVPIDPVEIADEVSATPAADRERVINAFRAKYDCTAQAVADEAEVHIRDLYKWIAGEIKDSSRKSKRIEAVLRRGLVRRTRP